MYTAAPFRASISHLYYATVDASVISIYIDGRTFLPSAYLVLRQSRGIT